MPSDLSEAVPRLKRLIGRLRGKRIGVLGDLMLDRYLWGTASRLSPEAAVPVVDFVSQSECLGGAGNVAANIAGLGARVEVFGVLGAGNGGDEARGHGARGEELRGKHRQGEQRSGKDQQGKEGSGKDQQGSDQRGKDQRSLKRSGDARSDNADYDEPGRALRRCLAAAHIRDSGVLADPDRVTTVKTRIIARHQQVVRVDHERRDPLSPATEQRLLRTVVAALKRLDALVLSDYDKGLVTDNLAKHVLGACHRLGVPVFVKPKTSRLYAYRGARAIVCNSKEAGFFLTRSLAGEQSLEEAGRALLAHFGCSAVLITQGENGMSLFEEGAQRRLHIPATSFEVTYARVGQPGVDQYASGRQVFDVTGAGDTVLSVLALAGAAGAPLTDAAMLANTAAGVVVGKLGTASVTPEELSRALTDLHH